MTDHSGIPTEILLKLYVIISKIRRVELRIESLYHEDEMKTPVHLCLGQEAISAGVCATLQTDDYVFSNHRSHGHYIAKGGDLPAMIAELYCKETGCSRGRGGSMHLVDTSVGLLGSSSIVGGGIPLAVGAALASVLRGDGRVTVVFFGDGASEEGVLYESMNFAALKKLPVVFVCENNFYSVCSHQTARQANNDISMRPRAFEMPSSRVDGVDVIDVFRKTMDAVNRTRSGKGPSFLECRAYRWRGHAGAGDNLKSQYRKLDEWDQWMTRDPLQEYEKALVAGNILTEKKKKQITETIDKEIDEAFSFAQASPLPNEKEVTKYLYS
ncbi:MAG: thiamine pyrophosphate-dependent dehydrogenase E1 component subunit alpha [Sedimentisphaerales bacterium]|nr:thiamine pyrophosphate-dependent dehydrogenase E1 component subunit alpha [Sedimentisphaerales bacterium]